MDFRNSFSPRSGRLKDLKDSFRHLVSRRSDIISSMLIADFTDILVDGFSFSANSAVMMQPRLV